MNAYFYSLLALDLARERSLEAERSWLADVASDGGHSAVRRLAARAFASVSLGSASLARRLDECIADDIGRNIALAD
jgi:hypothetical protein